MNQRCNDMTVFPHEIRRNLHDFRFGRMLDTEDETLMGFRDPKSLLWEKYLKAPFQIYLSKIENSNSSKDIECGELDFFAEKHRSA